MAAAKPKPKAPRKPRRRILCKVWSEDAGANLILYRDGYCRWSNDGAGDGFLWRLAHSDFGPIFLYNDDCNPLGWRTDWRLDDSHEVQLADTIARAIADLEMENVLKGKTQESNDV